MVSGYTQTIELYGESCTVTVEKTGKTTWKAYGTFKGSSIQGRGARTAEAAIEMCKYAVKLVVDT
jgi:hypothetical protein